MELPTNLSELQELLLPLSNRLMTAFILILMGMIIGRFCARLTERILHDLKLNQTIKRTIRRNFPLTELIALGVRYLVYAVFVILALNELGLTAFVVQITAAIFLGLMIFSAILSLKDFLPNFIASYRLYNKIQVGDTIECDGIKGRVTKFTMQDIHITTTEHDTYIIPSAHTMKKPIRKLHSLE